MTLEHFGKFIRMIIGDKISIREFEQIYKILANKKPLQFKKFVKLFNHI